MDQVYIFAIGYTLSLKYSIIMKSKNLLSFLTIFSILCFTGCSSDDDDTTTTTTTPNNSNSSTTTTLTDNQKLNTFTYEMLKDYYYWTTSLPDKVTSFPDIEPSVWLDSLRNTNDSWSYIEQNTSGETATKAFETGDKIYSTNFGFDISFGSFSNTSEYFAFVNYVYKGSPAEKAGIERGDIFIKIDGSAITTSNYIKLYTASSVTLTMGTYSKSSGSISAATGSPISLSSATYWADPVNYYSVITKGNKKIGYLMYTDFVSAADTEVDEVFQKFKEEGVTDVILDLRYNTGGEVSSFIHICSELAPLTTVQSGALLLQNTWNDTYMAAMKQAGKEKSLNNYFDTSVTLNLNMDHVYILTGYMTASASESTIIALQPYMTVTTIGSTTYGKCYGGPLFSPSDYKESWSSLDTWMLYCIGYKTANANGYTDFYNGIDPTVSVEQDIETVPVGDESDGLLSVALARITGTSATTKSASRGRMLNLNKSWVNGKGILRSEQYCRLPK